MGNSGDALFVPQRRQNRSDQGRQSEMPQLRRPAIELGNPDFAEVIESDGVSRRRGQLDLETPVPDEALPGRDSGRACGRSEFAQDKIPATPGDESAAA